MLNISLAEKEYKTEKKSLDEMVIDKILLQSLLLDLKFKKKLLSEIFLNEETNFMISKIEQSIKIIDYNLNWRLNL